MKKLNLSGQEKQPEPLYGKDRLVRDIQEFVGENGLIPFEHGYRPQFNMWAVTDSVVKLRFPIGRQHRKEVPLKELDEPQLTTIIIDLFRYLNWCHLKA